MMKKFLAVCLTSLMLVACGGDKSAKNSTDTTTSDTVSGYTKNPNWETITVHTQGDYPPFSFKDEHGVLIGFEKELLEAIATASEFNIDIIDAKRSDMLIHLNTDTARLWVSAISINPERQAEMELSDPYLEYSRSILMLDTPDNANIKTVADLQGKTIAYSSVASNEKDKAISVTKDESLAIAESSAFLAIKAVYSGKAVGTISNSPVLSYYTMQYPTINVRQITMENNKIQIAFAMKKGDIQLRDKLNAGLAKVKADGTYDKLIQKWFGQIQ